MTYNGVVVLQLDLMLEMEFIIIQFLNPSLLIVSSILTTPPMLVYQECTSTELTRTHVRIIAYTEKKKQPCCKDVTNCSVSINNNDDYNGYTR